MRRRFEWKTSNRDKRFHCHLKAGTLEACIDAACRDSKDDRQKLTTPPVDACPVSKSLAASGASQTEHTRLLSGICVGSLCLPVLLRSASSVVSLVSRRPRARAICIVQGTRRGPGRHDAWLRYGDIRSRIQAAWSPHMSDRHGKCHWQQFYSHGGALSCTRRTQLHRSIERIKAM
jgi:hypothetical protein